MMLQSHIKPVQSHKAHRLG